jgi:hypothetical protein
MKAKWIFKAIFGALFFGAAMGFVTMWLWNCLAVELFAAPVITFWQAIGLLILGRLLTGGFGHGHRGGWGEHWKHKYQMKAQMKERWGSMNEQERKDFMDSWKKRNYCGPFGKEDKEQKPDIETAD